MVRIEYVFPNLQDGRTCRGLNGKYEKARVFNCSYIEIPAIFIHNPSEEKITGKGYGEFLSEQDIEQIYEKDGTQPGDLKSIFHTDPGFAPGGLYKPGCIRWFDRQWTMNYVAMVVKLADYLGKHPDVIEIHPGSPENTPENLVDAMYVLQSGYREITGHTPGIVLENLTISHMKSGYDFKKITGILNQKYPDLMDSCGLVVDLSGIGSAWKKHRVDYRESIQAVPKNAVKGIHFHCNHGREPVDLTTGFWRCMMSWVHSIQNPIFLNPEVHNMSQFEPLMNLCSREFP